MESGLEGEKLGRFEDPYIQGRGEKGTKKMNGHPHWRR